MSKIEARRAAKIHLNKSERHRIRGLLLAKYGNVCCWCDQPMSLPERKIPVPKTELESMATIEHYYAIEADDPTNITLFRLAHKKCNK